MIAELSHNGPRLVKLNKSLALHRLLVVFISSNPAYYVIVPSLEILEQCLSTPGLESFQRSFETEGGFALLAKTLPGMWRDDIQAYVFSMLLGKDAGEDDKNVKSPGLISSVMGALEVLLQIASEEESGGSGRPSQSRTRSGTVTSVMSVALSPIVTGEYANSTLAVQADKIQDQILDTHQRTIGSKTCSRSLLMPIDHPPRYAKP